MYVTFNNNTNTSYDRKVDKDVPFLIKRLWFFEKASASQGSQKHQTNVFREVLLRLHNEQ